jgi:hypothetical protein
MTRGLIVITRTRRSVRFVALVCVFATKAIKKLIYVFVGFVGEVGDILDDDELNKSLNDKTYNAKVAENLHHADKVAHKT